MFNKLGEATRKFFGPRSVHALHVYVAALKAVLRDQILETEHMLPITNVSGPPNVGKTFASFIALSMLSSESLMLSRCTASSLLDTCDSFNSMLVVWDDPRDVPASHMCTIVHEAFHAHANSTVSKGKRRYNSSVLIGTQQKLVGLLPTTDNIPTISRISHVDMDIQTDFVPPPGSEKLLAECMHSALSLLVAQKYDIEKTNKLHKILNKITDFSIIDRAVRIAAIDWNLCDQLNSLGLNFSSDDIRDYFTKVQVKFLSTYCNRKTPFQRFVHDIKRNITKLPSESYRFVFRLGKRYVSRIFDPPADPTTIMWARWCLPAFNPNCDQDRKGHLADADNSSCDTLIRSYRKRLPAEN